MSSRYLIPQNLFRGSDKEHVLNLTVTENEFIIPFSHSAEIKENMLFELKGRGVSLTPFFSFRRIDLYYGSDEEHVPNLTVTEKEFIIPFSHSAGLIKSILCTC